MKLVPFTVHIAVVPARPGKRFEYLNDLAKLAVMAYDAIDGVSSINPAQPGGGQRVQLADVNRRGGLGSFASGTAAKPQIGANPAQLMLTGFVESSAENIQTYSNTQRISGGEVWSGPVQHSNDATPATTVDDEVKALKSAIESALATNMPPNAVYQVFRIDYSGIVYGDRGFHFPR